MNNWLGMVISFFMIVAFYWTNTWNTSYLPINSNKTFNNLGKRYNVSRIIDEKGLFNMEKYQAYSEPWMSAGNLTIYFWFFAVYTCSE